MLPRSRGTIEGLSGRARVTVEDTQIREILQREPDGGDHFWLKLQLQGLGNRQAVAALARAAKVEEAAIGHAGPRDRHAVVQRWMSVPKALVDNPGQLQGAGYKRQLRVLEVRQGAGPVHAGSVQALHCRLRLLDAAADDGFERAAELLKHLRQEGVPNYFGASALGPGGSFARWGRLLAQGKRLPNATRSDTHSRVLYERAWQARLFNSWVAARMEGWGLSTVVDGDVVQTRCNEARADQPLQLVDDVEAMGRRVAAWESVVTGPLWGSPRDEPAPSAVAAACEQAVLEASGPAPSRRCPGGRRAIRFQPKGAQVEREKDHLVVNCTIPVDAFAAVLAEELLNSPGRLS